MALPSIEDIRALAGVSKRTTSEYDARGVVTKVSGGTAYVRIDGSEIDTPFDASSVRVSVGDVVSVHVSHGDAHITGNRTDPAASSRDLDETNSRVSFIDSFFEVINSRVSFRDNAMRFLDKAGEVVASFGERVVLGVKTGCHVIIDKTSAVFMDGDTRLVSIGKSSRNNSPELTFGNGDMTLYEIIRRDSETGAVSSTEFYFNGYGCDKLFVFYGKDSQKVISLSDAGISLPGGYVSDFVIERGVQNYWTYEKWSSGKLHMRYRGEPTCVISTKQGGVYISAKLSISGSTFPIAFSSAPTLSISARPDGHDAIAFATLAGGTTTTTFGGYYLMRGDSLTTSRKYIVNIEANGFWK